MTQSNLGFPLAMQTHKVCRTSSWEYPFCGLELLNTVDNFGPCGWINVRCRPCCRLWETIYDHALKTLEHFMDVRDADMEINKDIRGRFWRHLTKHFQPIYLAAIKAGADLEKMTEVWEWDCNRLVISFIEEADNIVSLFPNATKKGALKKVPTHLLYVFAWMLPDGSIDGSGGCPFGVTNDIKRRRRELAPKHRDLRLQLFAIWDVGRRYAFPIESAIKRWNKKNYEIEMESLDMDIEIAMPFMESFIARRRSLVERGKGD